MPGNNTNITIDQRVWYMGQEAVVRNIERPLGTYSIYVIEVIASGEVVRKPFYQLDLEPPEFDSSGDEMLATIPLPIVAETEDRGNQDGRSNIPMPQEAMDSPRPTGIEFNLPLNPINRPRFAAVSSAEVNSLIDEQENKNTKRKTVIHVNLFQQFLLCNGENRKMEEILPTELTDWLCRFWVGIRKKDGQEYEPVTLRSMMGSFERHLRKCEYGDGLSLITSPEFAKVRETLKSKQKELKKQGKGNRPCKADPLTDEDVDLLYEKKMLGPYTPISVISTLWLNNTIHFGLRGGIYEHRSISWGDITVKKSDDGREYMELQERQTKTRPGDNPRDVRPVKPKMWASGDCDRCPVALHKFYASKRPTGYCKPEDPYYIGTNTRNKFPGDKDTWFISQPMGNNKLSKLMSMMVQKAEIGVDRKLTNHSARKFLVQKLSDRNVPPHAIMQITGHKRVESILSYSQINVHQHREISNILATRQDNHTVAAVGLHVPPLPAPATATCTSFPSEPRHIVPVARPISEQMTTRNPTGMFQGCSISAVTINYNNYRVGQDESISQENSETLRRPFKRLRQAVIDSDSDLSQDY